MELVYRPRSSLHAGEILSARRDHSSRENRGERGVTSRVFKGSSRLRPSTAEGRSSRRVRPNAQLAGGRRTDGREGGRRAADGQADGRMSERPSGWTAGQADRRTPGAQSAARPPVRPSAGRRRQADARAEGSKAGSSGEKARPVNGKPIWLDDRRQGTRRRGT